MIVRNLIEAHYNKNFGKFVKILSNRAGSVHNAEDVVQESFYRALKYRKSFNPELEELGAWFNKIMNNALRNSKLNERRMGMSVEYTEDMDEVVDLLEWEEDMIKQVKADINSRPEQVRQVLQLYIFQQYKPREIAQVLDMSNGYIRTIAKDFKIEMREKYGDVLCQ
jgi:RNA polymerase sigma factor (sigma-70 family)